MKMKMKKTKHNGKIMSYQSKYTQLIWTTFVHVCSNDVHFKFVDAIIQIFMQNIRINIYILFFLSRNIHLIKMCMSKTDRNWKHWTDCIRQNWNFINPRTLLNWSGYRSWFLANPFWIQNQWWKWPQPRERLTKGKTAICSMLTVAWVLAQFHFIRLSLEAWHCYIAM